MAEIKGHSRRMKGTCAQRI